LKRLERASLLLAASGTAMVWMLPYLFFGTAAPTWIVSRWYLIVCGPAALGGLGAFRRYAGFAKTRVVRASVALIAVGITWTDQTELGRGALLATGILVTLPLAALICRHDYLEPFMRAFSITTAAFLIYAFASIASFRVGTLVDSTGTSITNPNSVGIQAALASLFLLMTFPRRRRIGAYLFVFLIAVLVIFCVSTASRTAFLALAGAFVVSMLFLRSRSVLPVMVVGGVVALCSLTINTALDLEHPFYQGMVGRLIQDDEETRDTLGGRIQIWKFAAEEFAIDNTWLYGTGTGGVDKALGRFCELNGGAQGSDDIWRLSPHNTLVWWALAFGITGVVAYAWLGFSIVRAAYQLDKKSGDWRRSTLVAFVALAGIGGVITQEGSWCVLGAVLLAMLSTGAPGASCPPRFSHFNVHLPRP
jgi:O-antigen ligase